MKVNIVSIENARLGEMDMPSQFDEEIRPDLIKRAVLAVQSKRKRYGAEPMAGKKASAEISRRRRNYKGAYGHGISRVPRKILSRRGTRMNWVGAFAPGTVGGRRAHPPKAGKNWGQKINKKEKTKAIRSALAATINPELVKQRGHLLPEAYPLVLEDKFEGIDKTKRVKEVIQKLGLGDELKRVSAKSIRAGKGKTRGRKYRSKRGFLIVVSKECKLKEAAKNILGSEVESVNSLNAEILAPGALPGRLTIFTKGAIERLEKERLFM